MSKRTYLCDQCGGVIPFKWRDAGALKMEISYTNGGKRIMFTCAACRQKNSGEAGEKIPTPSEP